LIETIFWITIFEQNVQSATKVATQTNILQSSQFANSALPALSGYHKARLLVKFFLSTLFIISIPLAITALGVC
jgi:hypothetical protein